MTDAQAVDAALRGATVINCAAYTDVDGAESHPEAARAANELGARNVAAAADRVVHVSTDYVFDGRKRSPYVESDATGPLQEYGRSKLAGELAVAEANPRHAIVRSSWLYGVGGRNFVETMLALASERDELRVVDDQVGCPTFTGHLALALLELAASGEDGVHHVSGGGSCSWFEFARAIVGRTARTVSPCDDRGVPAPGGAAGLLGAGERARQPGAPGLAGRPRRLPRGCAREAARDRRAPASSARPTCGCSGQEHDIVVLDKLTYAGRRENLPEGVELVVGGDRGPRARACRWPRACDAVVNFAAESHVDRSIADQDAFARTHVIGTGVLLDAVRELGVPRYLQVSTDEVYGSIAEGSFTESSPLDPSSPYSATKAAGDLLVSAHAHTYGIEAVICRGSNNYGPRQYPEKLIPLLVLNALHGDPLPVYGDGRQVRNWLYVEDFCRGIHTVLERGRAGRGLQRRRPGRVREHRRGPADPRADRRATSR